MTASRVALGVDRLPWLPDEPARAPKRSGPLILWAIAAVMLVAAAAYWLGAHSETPRQFAGPSGPQTVRLPDAAPPASQSEVQPVPSPQVERVVAQPIPVIDEPAPAPVARPAPARRIRQRPAPILRKFELRPAPKVEVHRSSPPAARSNSLAPWPVRALDGASG